MSFLQPWMLLGLPLLAIPIIIHLINQWRYQTKKWGAMMFLLAANRMARGYARLRQWLIMIARMAAIAGLFFAASRPLSSGWLSLTGGPPDTTIIVLDRSPSMQERGGDGGWTKWETAKSQLRDALKAWRSKRWVLIDSVHRQPKEYDSLEVLMDAPEWTGADSTANVPELLLQAVDYVRTNRPGSTEIWVASDLRQSDWNPDSGQWEVFRTSVKQFPLPVRFHLLTYETARVDNLAIQVTDVRRERGLNQQDELAVSLLVTRPEGANDATRVLVQFEVQGARSEIEVDLQSSSLEIKDHRIAIDRSLTRGWGSVSLPADSNLADNRAYFVFDEPLPRRSVVLAQDEACGRILALITGIAPESDLRAEVQRGTMDQWRSMSLDSSGLILWQGPLPSETMAVEVSDFIKRGGRAFFFPPGLNEVGTAIGDSSPEFLGVRWMGWQNFERAFVSTWRGDHDLLSSTRSGAALPLADLVISASAKLQGDAIPLATLASDIPLFARVPFGEGQAYFCSTLPIPSYSNLAANGIVLYVAIQRALQDGMETLGRTRSVAAGTWNRGIDATSWNRLAGEDEVLSTEWSDHRGVFTDGERLLALNRSVSEDTPLEVSGEELDRAFEGVSYSRVSSRAGRAEGIVREIWRIFLALMLGALIAEAIMCLPKRLVARSGAL